MTYPNAWIIEVLRWEWECPEEAVAGVGRQTEHLDERSLMGLIPLCCFWWSHSVRTYYPQASCEICHKNVANWE